MLMSRRAGAPIPFTMSIRDYGSRLKAGTTSVKPQRIGYPAMRREQPSSRRLCRLQAEPRLDRVAHHEFLDLAGNRHREFVDEFDVARDFVVRDLALAEAADLLGRQRLAGSRPDPGAELLAVAVVGDARSEEHTSELQSLRHLV